MMEHMAVATVAVLHVPVAKTRPVADLAVDREIPRAAAGSGKCR